MKADVKASAFFWSKLQGGPPFNQNLPGGEPAPKGGPP